MSPFKRGDDVLVVGSGPVGLGVIQVLVARGAGKVLVSEPSRKRQEAAKSFGATHIVDPAQESGPVALCKKLCAGEGPAVVFDAAGVQSGLDLAIHAARTGATIVNIAVWAATRPQVDVIALTMHEKKYIGTMVYWKDAFTEVIKAMDTGKSGLRAKSPLL